MKILQVNNVYPKGSTGKITNDIHNALLTYGEESIVCYGRGESIDNLYVYKTCGEFYAKLNNLYSRISGVMYGGCFFSTLKLIQTIKKEKPDIVHLQCINGYFVNIYKLLEWLKKEKINTVLTLHAEFMFTANCGHALDCEKWKTGCGNCPRRYRATKSFFFDRTHISWRQMKKAFENFHNISVVSVSPWLMDRAIQSPMLKDKTHTVIYNGIDTEIFNYTPCNDVKNKYCPNNEKFVFHATASFSDDENDLKGGHHLIKLAESFRDQPIKFIVAGKYKVKEKLPDNIILLGNISDQRELAKLYSSADITLLLSKKETFSMIVAESLCCGTPVVGYKAGAPEQIALPAFSSFAEQGDITELKTMVKDFLYEKNIDKCCS